MSSKTPVARYVTEMQELVFVLVLHRNNHRYQENRTMDKQKTTRPQMRSGRRDKPAAEGRTPNNDRKPSTVFYAPELKPTRKSNTKEAQAVTPGTIFNDNKCAENRKKKPIELDPREVGTYFAKEISRMYREAERQKKKALKFNKSMEALEEEEMKASRLGK